MQIYRTYALALSMYVSPPASDDVDGGDCCGHRVYVQKPPRRWLRAVQLSFELEYKCKQRNERREAREKENFCKNNEENETKIKVATNELRLVRPNV